MTHERNERWAYVALAVLLGAFLVYRFVLPRGGAGFSVDLPKIKLGSAARGIGYLAAPLFAVVSELIRRRNARAARRAWEAAARNEGVLREEDDVRLRFVPGGRGATMQTDLRLTRAALYLIDKSGRRQPMRFALFRERAGEAAVADVTLREGASPERGLVIVTIGGESSFEIQFVSLQSEAWWSSIRRAMGKTAKRSMQEQGAAETE